MSLDIELYNQGAAKILFEFSNFTPSIQRVFRIQVSFKNILNFVRLDFFCILKYDKKCVFYNTNDQYIHLNDFYIPKTYDTN